MPTNTPTPATQTPGHHVMAAAEAASDTNVSVASAALGSAGCECGLNRLAGAPASCPRTPAELDSAGVLSQNILSAARPCGLAGVATAGLPSQIGGPAFRFPLSLDLRTSMRVVICADCSMLFLVPAAFWDGRRESGEGICCPAGHIHPPCTDPLSTHYLAEELADASHRLACQAEELGALRAKLGTAGVPDNREVRRRSNILSHRAEPAKYGELICPVCGKAKRNATALSNHLYRQHLESVRQMPAVEFA